MQKYIIFVLITLLNNTAYGAENEKSWIQDKNGCLISNLFPESGQSVTWSGKCDNYGYAEGNGRLKWYQDGIISKEYIGDMKSGKRHGTGKMTCPNGDYFEGPFLNDKRNGQGVYTSKSHGIKLKITFVDDVEIEREEIK